MTASDRARPLVALVTHPVEGAGELAQRLVAQGVAACVNLVLVQSVYRWEGEVRDDPETLLVVKTTAGRREELAAILAREHPYAVPELVVLEPQWVEAKYLAWLCGETGEGR
ncbi:MAG: divalent-cation tolerance protein CutA [Planctomycetota bacterium]